MNETRDPRGRFRPGYTPNPGGRRKSLTNQVREQTDDGAELVGFMLRIMRDDEAALADRYRACAWLADRAFGRPAPAPVESLAPEETRIVVEYVDAGRRARVDDRDDDDALFDRGP